MILTPGPPAEVEVVRRLYALMQPTDNRLGIVRLPLSDGRAIPLQLTYAALDAKGHDWLLDQFKAMQKGKPGHRWPWPRLSRS